MTPGDMFVLLGAIASIAAVLVSVYAIRQSSRKDTNIDAAKAVADAITLALAPLAERTSVVETKVDLMWINLQKNMAKIIHSPDPARAHVDALMDKIIHDQPMTAHEENETRDILNSILHYEPGQDIGFPVRDGEQTAAAWLLMSLDYVPIRSTK